MRVFIIVWMIERSHNVNMVRRQAMCECTQWLFSMQGECTWKVAELNNPEPTRGLNKVIDKLYVYATYELNIKLGKR